MERRPEILKNSAWSSAGLAAWCLKHLSSGPSESLFNVGHLSRVVGLRLEDGRKVVVKIRPWQDRLVACGSVQRGLAELGFPAPALLIGPDREDGQAISAEAMVDGGRQLGNHPRAASLFSAGLRRLIELASRLDSIGSLEPSPPWVGWDHAGPTSGRLQMIAREISTPSARGTGWMKSRAECASSWRRTDLNL
jgi:hypothetical protein